MKGWLKKKLLSLLNIDEELRNAVKGVTLHLQRTEDKLTGLTVILSAYEKKVYQLEEKLNSLTSGNISEEKELKLVAKCGGCGTIAPDGTVVEKEGILVRYQHCGDTSCVIDATEEHL